MTSAASLGAEPLDRHVRTIDVDNVSIDSVLASKRGRTVSVCIPCRDEAATIGPLVSAVRTELMFHASVVDELIVVDDRSTDETASVAARAGARVVSIEDVHAAHGEGHGKGNVLWATLLVSHGDIVVWIDGDVTSFEPGWVLRLIAPLLDDASIGIVKALYHRPTKYGGGGRTTELVARPLLSLYFPELTGLAQPLAGEYAVRRDLVADLGFVQGWGVEVAMLIDILERHGPSAIGQVDLGVRVHRSRTVPSLSLQAAEVMATILDRAGALDGAQGPELRRPDGSSVPLNLSVRPSWAASSRPASGSFRP